MIGVAAVDARADGTLIVQSYSRTDDWLWILGEHPVALAGNVSDEALGQAALLMLDRSRTEVPRPEDLRPLMKPLLAAAGVRSQRAYYEGTRSVGISRSAEGSVVVKPTRRDHRSFLGLADRSIALAAATAVGLGAAIREGLARSE
jgi:hypothetical protein